MQTPEQTAREKIDRLLKDAGWTLQDRDAFDRSAALGVAVREFPMPSLYVRQLIHDAPIRSEKQV
ncbi:MAG: hypothetical protein Tsb0032_16130 [Kiloniellaceae bacterium]